MRTWLDSRARHAPLTIRILRPWPWIRALTNRTTPWLRQPDRAGGRASRHYKKDNNSEEARELTPA
jgi:hypothetical protein